MPATQVEIRRGTYYDSLVLMQLQGALAALPGVQDAGVMMGTAANKEILAQSSLLSPEGEAAQPDDLLIVVRAEDESAARSALSEVDGLLLARRRATDEQEYLPQSLETAAKMLPGAGWVLVSVPGRYAAGVAREALRLGRHVFLYSDNVSVEEEVALKREAAARGLLVMGPDCGTAIVGGVGFGFANRVRRGDIGLIGASGTGLQAVTARIHQLGGGVSQALGTGGRDLSGAVGALTARQGLAMLAREAATRVIVFISKPPAPWVAEELLALARAADKPVVVNFIGYAPPARRGGNLHFVSTFDEAGALAVELAGTGPGEAELPPPFAPEQLYLRGLFSGGTLAYEALLILSGYLGTVSSNVPLDKGARLDNPLVSQGHTLVDLGEDEFTVGRLHPMMDNDLRLRRLRQEADDPTVALLLLDVVLGYGAHPDPASELAPAIAAARARAEAEGRHLAVVALVVGTDADPQGLEEQIAQLRAAGARVETSSEAAAHLVGRLLRARQPAAPLPPGEVVPWSEPLAALNVGLESFTASLTAQGATALQVAWRPPAGGNERLMAILERMKRG